MLVLHELQIKAEKPENPHFSKWMLEMMTS
jgi:hypothetical protein